MNLPSAPREASVSTDRQRKVDTRLQGHWLVLARMLWIAIFSLMLVVFCANLLVGSYGLVRTILLVADTSMWFAVGLVLFWRKSTDRAILLISLQLVLTGGFFFPPLPLTLLHYGAWWVPIDFLGLLAGVTLIFVYTFPDGRFVPGFTRWLALGWIAVSLLPDPTPGAFYPWHWWLSPFYTLVRIAFYGSLAFALLYRYRRMATPLQRQQIKWGVYGLVLTILVNQVFWQPVIWIPALQQRDSLYILLAGPDSFLMIGMLAISFGVAVLRYRLYEIDVLVNRALVYGSLTAILAAIYAGCVIGLQAVVNGLTQSPGQASSPILIVVTTLLIAALFQPLRRRLQVTIDQRFYRHKYDAAKVLASFSTTLRQEVDLGTLQEELVAVVQETMQPTDVSIWLRPMPRRERPSQL